jgi:cell division initiation protein
MKIGPVDIRNHTFQKKMRGIDDAEVRAYLDLVADRLEESIQEAVQLREAAERTAQDIREYRAMEKALRESLVAAERITEERLSVAEREARLIVKNAEVEGEKIVAHAREWSARYRAELEDLRRQRTTFLERFRALLSSQSKILEASSHVFMSIESGPALPADLPPMREISAPKDVPTFRDAQPLKEVQSSKDVQSSDVQSAKDVQAFQVAREAAALKELSSPGRTFPARETLTARDQVVPAVPGYEATSSATVPPPPPLPPPVNLGGAESATTVNSYLGEEGLFIPGRGALAEGERG